MFTKKRPDGKYIKNMHFFNQIMPYIMPTRDEASIYFEQEFDVTETLRFLKKKRAASEGVKLSLFFIILYASVRVIAQRPKLNRFISGYRYYQRNRISFNFVAKRNLNDEGEEVNITMSFSPFLSLLEFGEKLNTYIQEVKKGPGTGTENVNSVVSKLPRIIIKIFIMGLKFLDYHNGLPKKVIDSLPFYSTIFFTNVGSVGIDAPFHHNFNMGNCGVFCAIGKVQKKQSINADGSIEARDKVKLTFTYDDRITDGIYCAKSLDMLRNLVENPEKLESQFVLTNEQIKELGLAESELAV